MVEQQGMGKKEIRLVGLVKENKNTHNSLEAKNDKDLRNKVLQ